MADSRQTAFEVLYKIFYDKAYSNIALDSALSKIDNSKAFVSRLVYGVVERKLTLDYLISQHCNKSKPKLLTILRMGVYQLYFMDSVPSSAAINESVKLTKNNGMQFYSSMVNAVLHKIDNNRIDFDSLDDLSLKYSIPQNLIRMWQKAYGNERTETFLPAFNEPAPIFIVPNSALIDIDSLSVALTKENICFERDGDLLKIKSSGDITATNAFKCGLFYIQDKSCYEAVKALGIKKGESVIDVCAAPGGKSFTAAQFTGKNGKILSCDIYEQRVGLIKNSAKRLDLNNIHTLVNNAAEYNSNIEKADKIICDVPCSGFGIIRRKPEIRYKELDTVKELPDIQYSILKTSSEYMNKGGRILYSTCTLNKRENEKVVEKFINENSDFRIVESRTIFPEISGGDGFFYSVIERN